MARPRKSNYEKTVFAKRIVELQQRHKYTDQYIVDNVRDEFGLQFITTLQSYQKWKSGERLPVNLQGAIIAFADFYDVSVEYLIREDAPEKPQIKSVQDAIGLSVDAVRNLISFHNDFPALIKMMDTILSSTNENGIAFLLNLYNQILSDYKDNKEGDSTSSYDMDKMQQRMLRTQQAYNYISSIVQSNMPEYLDKDIATREDENEYYHSNDFISNNDQHINNITEVLLSHPDGTEESLHTEVHKYSKK